MIKAVFDTKAIGQYIDAFFNRSVQKILNSYQYAGERFIIDARSKTNEQGGFRDVTGNLRSSIGYILLINGKQVLGRFEEGGAGTDKATGVKKGGEFAKSLAGRFPKGIVLIVVAGMEYAAAVESRGKDVITGSSLTTSTLLKRLLNAR